MAIRIEDPEANDRLPVTLLTGFLGSGKTTVLNYLLRHEQWLEAAVVINEFGAIGLDHELVVASTENVVLLQNGCLCCSMRGDLMETLHNLLERRALAEVPPFTRVVIETTGLADPAPILHTLIADQVLTEQFRLDAVVTTVDAATAGAALDSSFEAVRQVAVADVILLTKSDLVGPDVARALEARLAAFNPSARISRACEGVVDIAGLFGAHAGDPAADARLGSAPPDHGEAARHDERIRSTTLRLGKPVTAAAFDAWLAGMAMLKGPDLLRVKGLVGVEGMSGPILIHGVQHLFHPPVLLGSWPSADRSTRIVVIGRDLDMELVERSLDLLRGSA